MSHKAVWVMCLCALPVLGNARADDNYVELSYAHSSGNYGTSVTTKLNRWMINAGVLKLHYFAGLSVPYLSLATEGIPTQSGLGDILANIGYRTERNKRGYSAAGSLSIKFPTADDSKFLGSGETDIGGFVALNKQWSDFIGGLNAGYIFAGNPPGGSYRNVAQVSISLFKRFNSIGANFYLNYRSAVIEGADVAVESGAAAYYVLTSNIALTGDAYAGLSDGSSDYGVQLGILRWF